jgi:hypothetical protein
MELKHMEPRHDLLASSRQPTRYHIYLGWRTYASSQECIVRWRFRWQGDG